MSLNETGEMSDDDIKELLADRAKKLPEVGAECQCGWNGIMQEVIDNRWKCPSCGFAFWRIL